MKKIVSKILAMCLAISFFVIPISAESNEYNVDARSGQEEVTPRAYYDFVLNESVNFKYDGDSYTEYFKVNVTQDLSGNLLDVYNPHEFHSTLPEDLYAKTSIIGHKVINYYTWTVYVRVTIYSSIFTLDSYDTAIKVSSVGPM